MAQVLLDKIMSACVKGICNAQRDYATWSGGLWLWEAPEYLSGTYVAQEICRIAGKTGGWFLTMENSAKEAMKDAGVGKGKLHSDIRSNGRFDLLLWWANGKPRAPIEIKCQVTEFRKIRKDIERLNKVIHRNKMDSSFEFGMSVFYTSSKKRTGAAAREVTKQRIDNIVKGAKDLVDNNTIVKFKSSSIKVVENSAWAAIAIVLKSARKSA